MHSQTLVARTATLLLIFATVIGCGQNPNSPQAKNNQKARQQETDSNKASPAQKEDETKDVDSKSTASDVEVQKARKQFQSLVKGIVGAPAEAKKKSCQVQLVTLEHAIKAYYLNVGKRPKSLDDLVKCPEGLTVRKWRGPYLATKTPKDPWGNPFTLEYGDNKDRALDILLSSSGPDGKPGTTDDITSE